MESVLNNKKVLIVDDYPINRMLFSTIVTDLGGDCVTASDGFECLEIVKKDNIDLILMDVNMPKMDGIVATVAIRALPNGKQIKIIGITGYEDTGEMDECFQAGMDEAVTKIKFTSEKLIEVSERIFSYSDISGQSENLVNVEISVQDHSHENSVFNYSKALGEFENNKELLDEVIAEFVKILSSQVTSMRSALNKTDIEFLRKESHSIKGGAANLCAYALSDAARELELACKKDVCMVEELTSLLAAVEMQVENFVNYCKLIVPSD